MSRTKFIGALVVSVALVGTAIWFRFFSSSPVPGQLVAVQKIGQPAGDAFLGNFFDTGASIPEITTTTPIQPGMVGRQLFSDYLALRSQNQVTPDNIDILADRYAKSIVNFEISVEQVSLDQIIILPDSEKNLVAYGKTMANIRNKYKNLTATQYSKSKITDINSQDFSTFMGSVAKLYKAAADEFLLIGVPSSLAENHLNLINNYLESVEIMDSFANLSKDPTRALAALNMYVKNSENESNLLSKIHTTLMANGIIFNSII